MRVLKKEIASAGKRNTRGPFFSRSIRQGFNSSRESATLPFFGSDQYIQPKLTLGQPGDKYEKEADSMADQVVQRLNNPSATQGTSGAQDTVQRKCDACEQEDKLNAKLQRQPEEEPEIQTKEEEEDVQMQADEEEEVQMMALDGPTVQKQTEEEDKVQTQAAEEEEVQMQQAPPATGSSGTAQVSGDLSKRIIQSKGQGQPMENNTRHKMQSAFGADFARVNIHTDKQAVQMNRELRAQAFTYGRDIYFNQGKYQPDTSAGQHLLAHELTHVVQQKAAKKIQRQPEKHDLTSAVLSGDPELEKCFDGEAIVKAPAEGEHVRKIQQALLQLGFDLGPLGADGKYRGKTTGAVKQFQISAGMSVMEWDGIVGKKTIGLLDMSTRNDRVETDPDVAAEDFTVADDQQNVKDEACKGKPTDEACSTESLKTVDKGADDAIQLIDKVLAEQVPPVKKKSADYPRIFTDIFRNGDNRPIDIKAQEVRTIYLEIKKFINKLKTDRSTVRCGTDCDGGCRSGTPAYHSFIEAVNQHVITFCSKFGTHPERTFIVIHEAHHAAIPGSADKAYAHTRLFEKLDHKTALLNAASFHVYAAWVQKPGSQPIGPEIKDVNLINNSSKKDRVDLSLAHIEQWFQLIPFDMSTTVQGAQEAKDEGVYKSRNARILMSEVFSEWFGLTAPPRVPSDTDIGKLKAIEERLGKMEDAFTHPFIILETPQHSFWERGPGSGIALNDELLNLDLARMIIALLQELVHATPNISAESEPLYVLTINDMRNLRALDP